MGLSAQLEGKVHQAGSGSGRRVRKQCAGGQGREKKTTKADDGASASQPASRQRARPAQSAQHHAFVETLPPSHPLSALLSSFFSASAHCHTPLGHTHPLPSAPPGPHCHTFPVARAGAYFWGRAASTNCRSALGLLRARPRGRTSRSSQPARRRGRRDQRTRERAGAAASRTGNAAIQTTRMGTVGTAGTTGTMAATRQAHGSRPRTPSGDARSELRAAGRTALAACSPVACSQSTRKACPPARMSANLPLCTLARR